MSFKSLTLAILETACGLVLGLLSLIPYVGWLFTLILSVLELGFFFLTVIGIINGVTCKARQLPIIGKYTLLKDVK